MNDKKHRIMKQYVLYLLLLIAVPATAQNGFFGRDPHYSSHSFSGEHQRGPLIPPGRSIRLDVPGMHPQDFNEAVRVINDENFDERRLKVAKQIVATNPMSAKQIAQVCTLFSFEANRLDFAKYAYHHCVDKNRYFVIYGVFNFEASKDELYKYIQEHNR